MDLNNAAIFAKVVEAGGFTAAARKLGIPKTTVSKKVSDLEADLGVRLLNRTTRQLSLTEAGAQFYDHCLAALSHMLTAEQEVRALQAVPRGHLRIGAPGPIGIPFLLPLILELMDEHVELTITLLSINQIIDLAEDRIDILVWPGPLPNIPYHAQQLARVEIGLFASMAYLARHGAPAIPAALATHDIVAFTQAVSGTRFVWQLSRPPDPSTVDVVPQRQPRFFSNDAAAIMAAGLAGQGICALPVRYAEQAVLTGGLVPILPDWRLETIDLHAFYRDGNASSLKTRKFLDKVVNWFAIH